MIGLKTKHAVFPLYPILLSLLNNWISQQVSKIYELSYSKNWFRYVMLKKCLIFLSNYDLFLETSHEIALKPNEDLLNVLWQCTNFPGFKENIVASQRILTLINA